MTVEEEAAVMPPITDPVALSIVSLVMNEVRHSEGRIIRELNGNADAAKGRWSAHNAEHEEMGKAVKDLARDFYAHIQAEKEEDLRFQARVGPITTSGRWLIREWRTVVIVLLLVADFIGQISSSLGLTK